MNTFLRLCAIFFVAVMLNRHGGPALAFAFVCGVFVLHALFRFLVLFGRPITVGVLAVWVIRRFRAP
jgi:hypothetical protein